MQAWAREMAQARCEPDQHLVQLFNSAIHHRYQVTSVLHKLEYDCGSTDLPMTRATIYPS